MPAPAPPSQSVSAAAPQPQHARAMPGVDGGPACESCEALYKAYMTCAEKRGGQLQGDDCEAEAKAYRDCWRELGPRRG